MNGGEIFVPRIQTMKVTDLATALAPDLRQKTVGIRPGEKLHEVMITEDDSRNTVALNDRYIILPDSVYWTKNLPPVPNAQPVPESFRYASETNDDWLNGKDIAALLGTFDT